MELLIYSDIKNGKLQTNVAQIISKFVAQFEGKRIEIKLKKIQAKRSGQQNKYIHVLFTILTYEINQLGNEYSMEEIKELCKLKFATIDIVNPNTGECIGQRIKGTREMSKTEISEFIEKIKAWSVDMFNITLPDVNEEIMLNFG